MKYKTVWLILTSLIITALLLVSCVPIVTEKEEVTPQVQEQVVEEEPSVLLEPVPETTSKPESGTKTEKITTDNKSIPQIPIGNELIPIRGVFIDKIQQLPLAKEIGANYVMICLWPTIAKTGEVRSEHKRPFGDETISLIRKAREFGFEVQLQIYPEFEWMTEGHAGELEAGPVDNQEMFIEGMNAYILHWAHIAQEEGVAIFSPGCEMNVFLTWENQSKWWRQLLPKLRGVFSGDLVQKGELVWGKYGLSPEGDLSFYDHYEGWDYVNTDIYEGTGRAGFGYFKDELERVLSNLVKLKMMHRAKGIIFSEINIAEGELIFDLYSTHDLTINEGRAWLWNIVLEQSIGHIDGFFFWNWTQEPATSVIKSYYTANNEELLIEVWKPLRQKTINLIIQAETLIQNSAITLHEYQKFLNSVKNQLARANEVFEARDYVLAIYLTKEVNRNVNDAISDISSISDIGILIDGYKDDWMDVPPLALDEIGDVQDKRSDLKSIYVTNDGDNLFFSIEFADIPGLEGVCLFLDTNSDDIWNYHIRCAASFAFLSKTISPDYHEEIAKLKYSYGEVIEFKVPLEQIGNPHTIKIQMFSLSQEKHGTEGTGQVDKDYMAELAWLTHTLH
jgi:hypothetical protein